MAANHSPFLPHADCRVSGITIIIRQKHDQTRLLPFISEISSFYRDKKLLDHDTN